jgi:hypothetical protein
MPREVDCYVTRVEQKSPPDEDRTGPKLVVEGGAVIVTAESGDAYVQFEEEVPRRMAVGDQVHITLYYAEDLPAQPPSIH